MLSGALGDAIGPLWGTAALGGMMLALVGSVLALSDVWQME
jgi:Na+/H+ antiporter NhaC